MYDLGFRDRQVMHTVRHNQAHDANAGHSSLIRANLAIFVSVHDRGLLEAAWRPMRARSYYQEMLFLSLSIRFDRRIHSPGIGNFLDCA
jgi:hypothetical protein